MSNNKPGKLSRAIDALFATDPDGAWSSNEIVAHVYGGNGWYPPKAQRVAVFRVLHKRANTSLAKHGDCSLVFYTTGSVTGEAVAWLKARNSARTTAVCKAFLAAKAADPPPAGRRFVRLA